MEFLKSIDPDYEIPQWYYVITYLYSNIYFMVWFFLNNDYKVWNSIKFKNFWISKMNFECNKYFNTKLVINRFVTKKRWRTTRHNGSSSKLVLGLPVGEERVWPDVVWSLSLNNSEAVRRSSSGCGSVDGADLARNKGISRCASSDIREWIVINRWRMEMCGRASGAFGWGGGRDVEGRRSSHNTGFPVIKCNIKLIRPRPSSWGSAPAAATNLRVRSGT